MWSLGSCRVFTGDDRDFGSAVTPRAPEIFRAGQKKSETVARRGASPLTKPLLCGPQSGNNTMTTKYSQSGTVRRWTLILVLAQCILVNPAIAEALSGSSSRDVTPPAWHFGLALLCALLVIPACVLLATRRKKQPARREPLSDTTPSKSALQRPLTIRIVADWLKLIGMRVRVETKSGDSYSGDVEDLTIPGTHVVLKNVEQGEQGSPTCQKRMNVPIKDISAIWILDRRHTEDTCAHV